MDRVEQRERLQLLPEGPRHRLDPERVLHAAHPQRPLHRDHGQLLRARQHPVFPHLHRKRQRPVLRCAGAPEGLHHAGNPPPGDDGAGRVGRGRHHHRGPADRAALPDRVDPVQPEQLGPARQLQHHLPDGAGSQRVHARGKGEPDLRRGAQKGPEGRL